MLKRKNQETIKLPEVCPMCQPCGCCPMLDMSKPDDYGQGYCGYYKKWVHPSEDNYGCSYEYRP